MANIIKNAQVRDQEIEKEQMHIKDIKVNPHKSVYYAIEGGRIKRSWGPPEGDVTPMYHYSGWWWAFVNFFSLYPMAYAIVFMTSSCFFPENGMKHLGALSQPFIMLELFFMFAVQLRFRGVRNRLVGRLGKLMSDVIAICAALMLRQCVPFDFGEFSINALVFLISLTIQVHSWAQILHLAGDISLKDVLMEVFMEVLIYISGTTFCLFLVFSFCGLICFKYCSYSTANIVEVTKKDLESIDMLNSVPL